MKSACQPPLHVQRSFPPTYSQTALDLPMIHPSEASPTLPASFVAKKSKILTDLAGPIEAYTDASPKGSIDTPIIPLIANINTLPQFVTTSSCSGRISVYLEGSKASGHVEEHGIPTGEPDEGGVRDKGGKETVAGTGGKGGGGRWLYVSHDPVDLNGASEADLMKLVGMEVATGSVDEVTTRSRLIKFKFEPLILHILSASLEAANSLVKAGMAAGFRESGAINLLSSSGAHTTPMVAIRSMGLGFESIIGRLDENGRTCSIISESLLHTFFETANERFAENQKRRERFWDHLKQEVGLGEPAPEKQGDSGVWEDKDARRERLRREGLERAKAKAAAAEANIESST